MNVTEDPQVPCPISVGMRLFIDHHIYEVERLTKLRAYLRRLTPGNGVAHETEWGLNYGPRINGSAAGNGYYIDMEFWRQSKTDSLIIVKSTDTAMLVERAKDEALPHTVEIIRLQEELKTAKREQHDAIVRAMTAEP
jgi:hypothetical protein